MYLGGESLPGTWLPSISTVRKDTLICLVYNQPYSGHAMRQSLEIYSKAWFKMSENQCDN